MLRAPRSNTGREWLGWECGKGRGVEGKPAAVMTQQTDTWQRSPAGRSSAGWPRSLDPRPAAHPVTCSMLAWLRVYRMCRWSSTQMSTRAAGRGGCSRSRQVNSRSRLVKQAKAGEAGQGRQRMNKVEDPRGARGAEKRSRLPPKTMRGPPHRQASQRASEQAAELLREGCAPEGEPKRKEGRKEGSSWRRPPVWQTCRQCKGRDGGSRCDERSAGCQSQGSRNTSSTQFTLSHRPAHTRPACMPQPHLLAPFAAPAVPRRVLQLIEVAVCIWGWRVRQWGAESGGW